MLTHLSEVQQQGIFSKNFFLESLAKYLFLYF